jgi:hypothetical protein
VADARAETGPEDDFECKEFFDVNEPSPPAEILFVVIVRGSTIVERRRLNPLNSPLEKLLVFFGLTMSVLAVAIALGLAEAEAGGVDTPPPPRMGFASCAEFSIAASLALFLEEASLSVTMPPRDVPEGLGIIEPAARDAIDVEILLVLEVVDMYIGGRIVGAGLALGGSIADNVYNNCSILVNVNRL